MVRCIAILGLRVATEQEVVLLRLAKYSDFGTRAQHTVLLQFEHGPCHHNVRDSVTGELLAPLI